MLATVLCSPPLSPAIPLMVQIEVNECWDDWGDEGLEPASPQERTEHLHTAKFVHLENGV